MLYKMDPIQNIPKQKKQDPFKQDIAKAKEKNVKPTRFIPTSDEIKKVINSIINNSNKHIANIEEMKDSLTQFSNSTEYKFAVQLMEKSDTANFVKEFSGLKDNIKVNIDIKDVLLNPIGEINKIFDLILKMMIKTNKSKINSIVNDMSSKE